MCFNLWLGKCVCYPPKRNQVGCYISAILCKTNKNKQSEPFVCCINNVSVSRKWIITGFKLFMLIAFFHICHQCKCEKITQHWPIRGVKPKLLCKVWCLVQQPFSPHEVIRLEWKKAMWWGWKDRKTGKNPGCGSCDWNTGTAYPGNQHISLNKTIKSFQCSESYIFLLLFCAAKRILTDIIVGNCF